VRAVKVLLVSAEVAPFAKVGGLADVAGSLPKALANRGLDIRVLMPKYRQVIESGQDLWRAVPGCPVAMAGWESGCALDESRLPGSDVPIYFVEHHDYFEREGIYGPPGSAYPDNLERLTFLCRAALAVLEPLNWQPDVIHLNDWHTSLLAVYTLGQEPATLFTMHNVGGGYQGAFGSEQVPVTGLDSLDPTTVEFIAPEGINLARAGLACADVINTVSPTYAKEIASEEFAPGLSDLVNARADDVYGILNGIDYAVWNPATDPALAANFTRDDLSGKATCKAALQKEAGLKVDPDIPLVGTVTRLAAQKGLDLLEEALPGLTGVQLVILGTGERHYEEMLRQADADRDDLSAFLRFDAQLARRIYAGSDMFLMPSRYEPCGLGQMIAMAYGTVPIVRTTGGLADTVTEKGAQANGFVFTEYSAGELVAVIRRALAAYAKQAQWRKRVQRAMSCDFSWDASAARYHELYQRALSKYHPAGWSGHSRQTF